MKLYSLGRGCIFFIPGNVVRLGKLKYNLKTLSPHKVSRGAGTKTRLRGQLTTAVDPMNLNQVILAEGKNVNKSNNVEHYHRKTSNTLLLAEIAIFVALATALSFIIVYTLPQGGSITAGSMVPILWLALRRGPKVGIITGVLYGIVQLVVLPFAYNPIQVLLDYPLAFGCLGLAGFFRKWPVIGVVVGISGRFVMHFFSGVFYFAAVYAPELNPYVYSAVYNGSYLLPEMAISIFIIFLLQKSKALKIYL
jgi:thiamine transporter